MRSSRSSGVKQSGGASRTSHHQFIDTSLFLFLSFFFSFAGNTKLATTSPLPGTMMHIYAGDYVDHIPAENVKIGDLLTLVVALDKQDVFGLTVADCSVRDGLGWSDQPLYNDQG